MKLLVSSKALAKELSEINFSEETIMMAELMIGERSASRRLTLYGTKKGVAQLPVESKDMSQCLNQSKVRWDWVYDAVSKIPEQPIVLDIYESGINVILQY